MKTVKLKEDEKNENHLFCFLWNWCRWKSTNSVIQSVSQRRTDEKMKLSSADWFVIVVWCLFDILLLVETENRVNGMKWNVFSLSLSLCRFSCISFFGSIDKKYANWSINVIFKWNFRLKQISQRHQLNKNSTKKQIVCEKTKTFLSFRIELIHGRLNGFFIIVATELFSVSSYFPECFTHLKRVRIEHDRWRSTRQSNFN